ncbi:B-type lectin plumieribetin-like [Boleophthalmus pectinirostris]|uniref:B-type lectin plumieribetin-like n=1 Tax=Boleophthalmus pectinirostris TaxID=150288 RepID=UPI002431DDB5|nr:B-type lectin plumieribetin-like [Boleophthalmus pectinirostris]
MSKSSISTEQELRRGDCLVSNNGNYKAVFQEDGNFVVYKWTPVWATNTVSTDPRRIVLQSDTNLVMYSTDKPLWCTGNHNKEGSQRLRLTMTDHGRLEVEEEWKSDLGS